MDTKLLYRKLKLTDEKIATLRLHFQALKTKALASVCKKEEERLKSENLQLEENIADLKRKLVEAEIMNGKAQVSMSTLVTSMKLEGAPVIQSAPPSIDTAEPVEKKSKTAKKPKKQQQPAKPTEGVPVDVSRLDLRVARIVKAEKHPDANTLYVEDVETGETTNRTVISGLVQNIPIEEVGPIYYYSTEPIIIRLREIKTNQITGSFPDAIFIVRAHECYPHHTWATLLSHVAFINLLHCLRVESPQLCTVKSRTTSDPSYEKLTLRAAIREYFALYDE